MIIKITNWNNTKTFFVRKLFSFSANTKINDMWKMKVSFSNDIDWLDQFEIKKWYKIQVYLPQDKYSVWCVFSGYIEEIEITDNLISIFAYDFISYFKYRLLRTYKVYTNKTIEYIIFDIFAYLNSIHPLPIKLWKNDCKKQISIEFKKNTSLYTILNELVKKVENLEFRQIASMKGNAINDFLDISTETWIVIEWVWQNIPLIKQRNNGIISWSWKDDFDDFCNYWSDNQDNIVINKDSIDESWLFEKYETNPETTPDSLNIRSGWLPSLKLDLNKNDISKINIGDRKKIKIISKLWWIAFEYLWIIQEIKISSTSSSWVDFQISIWEKIVNQKNILDRTLEKFGAVIGRVVRGR